MNDEYLRAKQLFETNQFSDAFYEFLEHSHDPKLDSEQKIEIYQYIFKCLEYDRQLQTSRNIHKEFLEILISSNNYMLAKKHIESIKEKDDVLYLRYRWEIEYELGNVETVLAFISKEIDYMAQRGLSGNLAELKEKILARKISYELEMLIDLLIDFIQAKFNFSLDVIKKALSEKNIKLANKKLDLVMTAYQKLSPHTKSSIDKSLTGKCIEIQKLMSQSSLNVQELKKTASCIFEAITLGLDPVSVEAMISRYTQKSKRKDFYLLCEEIFTDKKGVYQQLYRQRIEEEIDQYQPMRTIDHSEMDFGTDLFREDNISNYDASAKKERLIREILILQKADKFSDANVLIQELAKIDDQHALVKDLNESLISENASRLLKKRDGIDEIVRRITNEISAQSKTVVDRQDKQENWGTLLLKSIEYMESHEFKKNQRDLLVSCLNLNFPEIAQKVLDDKRGSIDSLSLDYDYFKISILINQHKEHLALDYCSELLQKKVLLENEYVTFLYLKAELLRALGKSVEATKAYRKVWEIDPKYRLARFRMLEIDQY